MQCLQWVCVGESVIDIGSCIVLTVASEEQSV